MRLVHGLRFDNTRATRVEALRQAVHDIEENVTV